MSSINFLAISCSTIGYFLSVYLFVTIFRECLNVACSDDSIDDSVLVNRLSQLVAQEEKLNRLLKSAHDSYQPPQPHPDQLEQPKNPIRQPKSNSKAGSSKLSKTNITMSTVNNTTAHATQLGCPHNVTFNRFK